MIRLAEFRLPLKGTCRKIAEPAIDCYNSRQKKTRSRISRSGMENIVLTTGIKGNRELIVTEELTAQAIGSGELPVLATPAVIALAEETAWRSVAAFLEPGQGTVGTKLDVEHISATPVGMKVKCETELTEIDRRKLTFSVAVFDEAGVVAKGTHCRFIVENEKFLKKAESKSEKKDA